MEGYWTKVQYGSSLPPGMVFAIGQEWERRAKAKNFMEISLAVCLLIVKIMVAGWLTGWACALGATDRWALAMVLVGRHTSVAMAVAVTILGRIEFAAFATAYFLNQVPLIVFALVLVRLTQALGDGSPS